jgi:uroporphyrinogen decarboxylase
MSTLTSLERVLTTLGHQEPDRVPFFLLLTTHGAKELNLSIRDYFAAPENVVEGQLRLRARYRHDCLNAFFYAAIETEAWGVEPIYVADGPPNSGAPFIQRPKQIEHLQPPPIDDSPCLQKVLQAIRMLKNEVGDEAPIIGVVMSPFSLPVMQLGFESYLDLIHDQPLQLEQLLRVNESHCVAWANAQLAAGATAICYFDPMSSSTIVPRQLYLKTGFEVARRTIASIAGPTATHLASARCLPIADDIARTGTAVIGTGCHEDLSELKQAFQGKLAVLGNLNGIEMRRWRPEQAEVVVKEAIAKAGQGGGYILSDSHGEIPFFVPDDVLMAISDAVHRWGVYPLVQPDGCS